MISGFAPGTHAMQNETAAEPDWDTPLTVTLTPALLIHALFATANTVHTGWTSCVEETLSLNDLVCMDERTGSYCRLVEQEYVEDDNEETVWHDWAVEVRLGNVLVTGHWQIQTTLSPMDWDWCAREAERAFEKACVLFGRRIRRGVGVEEPNLEQHPPRQQRH
jgi:lysozyme family protein